MLDKDVIESMTSYKMEWKKKNAFCQLYYSVENP